MQTVTHWCEQDEGLEPSMILPEQALERRVRRTPEQELMIAVLDDAIHIYCTYVHTPCRRFREVARWFANPDRTRLFSFEHICDVLDLDAVTIRRRLGARVRHPERAGRHLVAVNE